MSAPTDPLAGGVAVVTGAGSGLGEALARSAADRGMHVVLADVVAERVEIVATELESAGHEVLAVATDVSDPASVEQLAAATHERFGPARLVVSNAGIHAHGPMWEMPAEVFGRVLRVNVNGCFHCVRSFVPGMLETGEPGFVVCVASNAMAVSTAGQSAYNASKHAVQSLAESLYLELQAADAKIRVSTVIPNAIATRMHDDAVAFDAAGAERRERSRAALRDDGIDPAVAAGAILDQVAEGRFWVLTHPESTQRCLRHRSAMLAEMRPPEPPR